MLVTPESGLFNRQASKARTRHSRREMPPLWDVDTLEDFHRARAKHTGGLAGMRQYFGE